MTSLISFSNKKYALAGLVLRESAKQFGISRIAHYTEDDFRKTDFFESHKKIGMESFGAGYFLWKPYYISQQLKSLPEGSILMYLDSGHAFVADPSPLVDLCREKGIILFSNTQSYPFFSRTSLSFNEHNCYREINTCKYWTKGDAFALMGLTGPQYEDAPLVDASIMIFYNDERSRSFVDRWLNFSSDLKIIGWDSGFTDYSDHPELIFHRHDQSIISLLAAEQDIELFRCPSQYGNHLKMQSYRVDGEYCLLPYAAQPDLKSPYGTITQHHRYKARGFNWRLKRWLYVEYLHVKLSQAGKFLPDATKLFKTPPYKVL